MARRIARGQRGALERLSAVPATCTILVTMASPTGAQVMAGSSGGGVEEQGLWLQEASLLGDTCALAGLHGSRVELNERRS